MNKLCSGIVVILAAMQLALGAENGPPTTELLSHITNSRWQWDGTGGEAVVFKEDGYVEHDGWTRRGLLTRWQVIDRRTVLLKIEKGRARDLYAVLMFNEDFSSFEGLDFHNGSKVRSSQRADKKPEVLVDRMPPSVVKTVPQAGDTEVDPSLEEIRVTFSKDMMTDRMWSFCRTSADTFPKRAEDEAIHYLPDKRTCVLPVRLEANRTYVVWMNRGRFNSFRDTNNNPAVPYLLVFQTKEE